MLLKKPHFYHKKTLKKPNNPPLNWRNNLKNSQLVTLISSTLLQKQNWASTLKPLSLSSSLTPQIFNKILINTQTNPQLSLSFFNFAKSNLGFKPQLKTLVLLIRVLNGSGLAYKSKPIFDLLIQTYPPGQICDSVIEVCKDSIFYHSVLCSVFSSVIEHYCENGCYLKGFEVYKIGIGIGFVLSVRSCNSLLDNLEKKNESRLAWGLYGNMVRNGVLADRFTWDLIARILFKDGKFETIVRILDMGVYSCVIYNLVIDFYSKKGEFRVVFDRLNEMYCRKVDSGFSTYSSILDGACKLGDDKVVERVMFLMSEKGLLFKGPITNYDLIIRKLSELGRTYSSSMFFDRACGEKRELNASSYGCMLKAFSKGGRVREAIQIYREILDRDIVVDDCCYVEFVNVLCGEEPSEEISGLLEDIIGRGISPCVTILSDFITRQCGEGLWRDVEELMNAMLVKEIVPSSSCCSLLVLHYCNHELVEEAIDLHNKLKNVNGALDVITYNVLINGLMKEKRVEDANTVFDYMKTRQLMDGESYSIMIRGLCQENDFRRAMKMHDEMLKLGLKPDLKAYKRLILCFK